MSKPIESIEFCRRALEQRESFSGEQAAAIHWQKPFRTVVISAGLRLRSGSWAVKRIFATTRLIDIYPSGPNNPPITACFAAGVETPPNSARISWHCVVRVRRRIVDAVSGETAPRGEKGVLVSRRLSVVSKREGKRVALPLLTPTTSDPDN